MVGNIGSPTRLSYTIVGDTVNVASRVEELNRMLQPEAEAAILLSGETVRALTRRHELSPVGSHALRGRNASVELFTVPGEPSPEHLPPASEAMHVDDPDLASADSLLAFWFAPGTSERWFVKDPAFDAELGRRFGALAEAAARGELDHWAATPRGALALVILLDQLPRNLHRGRPQAFTQDAKARAVAAAAIEEGHDAFLTPPERLFLYLPFEHSERSGGPGPGGRAVHGLGRCRAARLCPAASVDHPPLRPLPAPERGPRAPEHGRGGGVPRRPQLQLLKRV